MRFAKHLFIALLTLAPATWAAAQELPSNLALAAKVTANSEQGHLPAVNVADGRIVPELATLGEMGSWAVDGGVVGATGEITFTWDQPVEVAEVIYFGRCSWQLAEAFKDYEVYVEGVEEPIATGALEAHGRPQAITFEPVTTSALRVKFLSSHGGPNPGANEIMVFSQQLDEEQLARITQFQLNSIINDHMVYQQGKPVRVWGAAADGEEITVDFAGNTGTTTAENGEWMVELPVAELGQGGEIHITSAAGDYTISDVLVGEVWIASGQSNMEMPVGPAFWPNRYDGVANHEAEIAAADYPEIRCFYVPRVASHVNRSETGGRWSVCTPETAGGFTGVGYFFARKLHEELGVPVAIVDASWGATVIETWIPQEGFDAVPELQEQATQARQEAENFEQALAADPNISTAAPHQNVITGDYKGMIDRLRPFGIRGVIWYQGEGNVGQRMAYYHKMHALVEGWRQVFDQGEFPFVYVQLAPYDYGMYKGSKNNYHLPSTWEAQTAALDIPNTGMAVTTDITETANIHPSNKQDVGLRLALWALANTYGQDEVVFSGPMFESFEVEGDSIRIDYQYGEGLQSRDGEPLNWFTIAGEDQVFHEATATIEGDTVVVRSDEVASPVAVRFAWHKLANPNLAGSTGLPAVSFRTDDWDVQIGLVEDE